MKTKREQPRSFERALRAYGSDSPTEAMTDFIADAMHFCRSRQVDFDHVLATATMHFDAECVPVAFDDYEISGVREYGNGTDRFCERVSDDDAQFWSLYGHIPGQGAECIGTSRLARLPRKSTPALPGDFMVSRVSSLKLTRMSHDR